MVDVRRPSLHCDVCGNEEIAGVASSALGPFSFAYCHQCLKEKADVLWFIHATFDCVGGPEHVAEWVKEIKSFKDGKYITFEEVVACYTPTPLPDEYYEQEQKTPPSQP